MAEWQENGEIDEPSGRHPPAREVFDGGRASRNLFVLLSINFLLFMHVFCSNTLPTFKLRCSFLWASQTQTLMATKNTKRHNDYIA